MTKSKKSKRRRNSAEDVVYCVVNVIWYALIAFCFFQFGRLLLIEKNYYFYDNTFHRFVSAEYDENLFTCECEVTNYYLNNVQKKYDLIPCEIRDDFEAHGGSVIIKEQIPYTSSLERFDLSSSDDIIGLYSSSNMCITLKYNNVYDTILHEMGHFYSKKYDLSENDEFVRTIEIEKNELNKITNISYLVNFDDECYAEAFRIYFTNPKKLEKACPNTYKIIKSDIENASIIIENGGKI